MKKTSVIILFQLLSVLVACRGGEASKEDKKASDSNDRSASSDCLLKYRGSLDELLTLERAANISGQPKEQVKQKYSRVMKNEGYHSVQYVWKTGRHETKLIMGREMAVPANDIVELHGLKEVSLEYFKKSHRAPTPEELSAVNKEVERTFDGESANEEVKKKLKKLDDMKVSKETQKSTALGMTSVFAEVARSYSEVDGVGQAAAWNSFENRLYVFDGGIELAVTINLGSNGDQNRKKAIELCQLLLDGCQK